MNHSQSTKVHNDEAPLCETAEIGSAIEFQIDVQDPVLVPVVGEVSEQTGLQ